MTEFFRSFALILSLLNPFLVVVYLIDIIERLNPAQFRGVLLRAGMIASVIFCAFAFLGDALFTGIFQAEFASFQIFGGIVFLVIGIQYVFYGPKAVKLLTGESEQLAGAIAMPVLIGPGTISASVVIGKRLDPFIACAAILVAVTICIGTMIFLKSIHDYVRERRANLIQKYVEITGRITALYIGTIAVEMIVRGILAWSREF